LGGAGGDGIVADARYERLSAARSYVLLPHDM
jgi:hypothetical protein